MTDAQEQLQRLQMLDQTVQQLVAQKQQFQSQLYELESALKEIMTAPQAYKIIGSVMVASNKEDLKKDLDQKKELVELRIKTFEKQETQMREKLKSLQEDVLKSMKK
ncbi:MAG TPA: prefoldin subunit beta [Candidatus Binatia bacterium]|nr:prefoldin subunit beta [Candidatus Binatia bacterium]